MKYLNKSKDLSWNDKNEIEYKGKTIKKSNILSLLKHAVHKTNSKPKGVTYFYKGLAPLSIPTFVIINKLGRVMMKNNLEKDDNLWKPPGVPNSKRKRKDKIE